MKSTSVMGFLSIFVLSACTTRDDLNDVSSQLVPTGYYCSTTPSEAYSPGYVYRVDKTGAELLVDQFSQQAETFSFKAALGSYIAEVSRSAGLNFSLLELPDAATADAEAKLAASKVSKVAFKNGQFELMNDAGFRAVADLAGETIEPVSGSEYFLVRDSIQAKGVEIKLSAENEASLGGEAKVTDLFSAKPNVKVERKEELTVNETFDDPLNVCIRPVRLEFIEPDNTQVVSGATESPLWRVTNIGATPNQAALILSQ